MTGTDNLRQPVLVGALVTFLASVALAVGIERPLIMPDESGHILNALQLRGSLGANGLGYYHGYSALLSPFINDSMSLHTLTIWVQLVNSALAAATFVMLWFLAQRLRPDVSERKRLVSILVVMAYPAYRLFAALALSENLLVPAVVGVLLLLLRAQESPSAVRVVALGVGAGLTATIHPRSIVIPLATVVAGWLCLQSRRWILSAAALIAAAASLAAQSQLLTSAGIADIDSGSRDTLSGIVKANLSLVGIVNLPLTALGQVFYITAGTLGLVALGVAALFPLLSTRVSRPNAPLDGPTTAAIFIGVLVAGSLVVSALFLNRTTGDQAIYGRYLEGVFAPMLLVGALQFLQPTTSLDRVLRTSLVAMGLAVLVLLAGRGASTFDGRQQLLNITSVFPVVRATGRIRLSDLLLFTCVGTTALFIARRFSATIATSAIVVTFLAIAVSNVQVARAALDNLTGGVVDLNEEITASAGLLDLDCVALDQFELGDRWHQEDFRLRNRELTFEYWDSATTEAPCSPLVLSGNHEMETRGQLIAAQPDAVLSLWILDEAAADRLAAAGIRLVERPTAPLAVDHEIALDLIIEGPRAVKPGELISGDVIVTNNGSRPLIPNGAFSDAVGVVNIGLDWRSLDAATELRSEPTRVSLPEILDPGQSVTIPFRIRAANEFGSLEPGSYLLTAESVQEGVRWTEQIDEVDFIVRWKNQGE